MSEDEDKTDGVDPDETVLRSLLAAVRADRATGRVRPLGEYLGRFPGQDEQLAGILADDQDATLVSGSSAARGEAVERVGRYRIVRELGRGGQAVVYLAEDAELGRRVALKVLTSPGPDAGGLMRRFRREAEVTSRLEHPGICPVYETGAAPTPFIAMRYVEGETLAQKIRAATNDAAESPTASVFVELQTESPTRTASARGRTTLGDGPRTSGSGAALAGTLRFIESAARALHAAHEAGVIHRDVKPGNIMVAPEGSAVLLDFGLARAEDAAGPELTVTGDVMGTPAYMSPEQVRAKNADLDRRTDVYSLGVTLYECLLLRRPFEAPTRQGLYEAILHREPEDPRRRNPLISKDLAVVVATAMAKEVDARYATALEFAEELRRVRTHEPIVARPAGPILRLRRWSQRNPALAAAVFAAFIILSVATVVVSLQKRRVEQESQAKSEALLEKDRALTRERDAVIEKQAALAEFERLADMKRLQEALALAEGLHPARPEKVVAMESWLATYRSIADRLPDHEAALARLRATADPVDDAAERRHGAADVAELDDLRSQRAAKETELTEAISDAVEARLEHELEELEDRIADLETRAAARLSWTFGNDDATRWKHDVLTRLVHDVRAFADPRTGTLADIERRLETARTIAAKTVERFRSQWDEAIAYASRPAPYGGLHLVPLVGLIPLGPDPSSKLLEFVHQETHAAADLPMRGTDGRLLLTEDTGIILVLIPGGTFAMGAQSSDATSPNYDAGAQPNESPVHEVTLDAYLLAKYEVTQGQWERLTGTNPSDYLPDSNFSGKTTTRLHAVEQVSWEMGTETLRRVGLVLPTEAQWERAARAGTSTVWCSGDDQSALDAWGNLSDSFARSHGVTWIFEEDLDDGYVVHAPVGLYRPNRFGLHDVIGNVWEWCRDLYDVYTSPPAPGDGLRRGDGSRAHVNRGGSFMLPAAFARSAQRDRSAPGYRHNHVGLRACAQLIN